MGSNGIVNLQSLSLAEHQKSNHCKDDDDTLISISCDSTLPLERRLNLLAFVFAKAVQGEILRRVLKWDLTNGCIKFVVAGHSDFDHPRGKVVVERQSMRSYEQEHR